MGVLDDAIRDHLDLKRRHGAAPEEIEQAEREALGPVRRGPEDPDALGAELEEPTGYDHEDDAGWEEPSDRGPGGPAAAQTPEQEGVFDHAADLEDAPTTIQPAAERQQEGPDEEPFAEEEPFADEEPFSDEPPSGTPRPHAAPGSAVPEHPEDETAEYNVDEALSERERKDEDVLEETPDFLQDAPDHDRLWFEQRPPKDFDFNE